MQNRHKAKETKMEITWKDVYDCKLNCDTIDATAKRAKEGGYSFFCHNDKIYGEANITAYDKPSRRQFVELPCIPISLL